MLGYILHQIDREALAKAYADVVEEAGAKLRVEIAEIMKPDPYEARKQRMLKAQSQGRIMGVAFTERIGP